MSTVITNTKIQQQNRNISINVISLDPQNKRYFIDYSGESKAELTGAQLRHL